MLHRTSDLGISVWLLWTRWWTLRVHKRRGKFLKENNVFSRRHLFPSVSSLVRLLLGYVSYTHSTLQIKSSVFCDITPLSPQKSIEVSDKYIACLLRVEKRSVKQTALLSAWSMLASCLAHSSTLKMETICSSGTSAEFQWTTRFYIPEYRTFHSHCCENLKSNFNLNWYCHSPVG
jgi:hypothetical protein